MIYLDNAATSSPKPVRVADAVYKAIAEVNANPGRSGHDLSLAAGRKVLECREEIAGLMGAKDPFSIVFGFNCTDMLNLAIKGVLRKGDHVISSLTEHNSVLRVLMEMERQNEISITLVGIDDSGCVNPDDIERAINPKTKLIALTHASNVTGAIQPVAAVGNIAKKHGVKYLIDGAQALGCMPVDVTKLSCDMYAFPGHKGLLGVQGTGGLYIDSDLTLATLREGGTGSSSESMLQPSERPERYEAGTLNYHGIAGLCEGVKYVKKNLSQIYMRERELTSYLYDGIQGLSDTIVYTPKNEADRCGIVSFNIGDLSSSQTADMLNQFGIAVRGGLHCAPGTHYALGTLKRGAVRASVGHETSFEEIEELIIALHKIQTSV